MRVLVVTNTGARGGRAVLPRLEAALAACADDGIAVDRTEPEGIDSVEEVPDRLIAVGGDGTVNLCLRWLLDRDATVPLGIIPSGTGNNLARGLGLPLAFDAAFALALGGTAARSIDGALVGCDGEERRTLLVQVGGLGFPADVARDYDRGRRRPVLGTLYRWLGDATYRCLALRRLLGTRRAQLQGRFVIDGHELERTFFGLFIGNEGTIGGDFRPCPDAVLDDGRLELTMATVRRFRDAARLFRAVSRGTHREDPRTAPLVVDRPFRESLEIELDRAVPLLVDGDLPLAGRRFSFRVLPRRFPVVVGV